MFSLFVWMELCMNTSKIRVFYARLEISAFLQPLEQLLGVGFLDLTKQSASGEKLSENLSAGQNLNRPPLLPLKKQNRERVRLKFYRWPLGRRKKSDWLFITERKVQVKTTPGTKFPDPGLSFPFSFSIRGYNSPCWVWSQIWNLHFWMTMLNKIQDIHKEPLTKHFCKKSHNSISSHFYLAYIERLLREHAEQ